MLPFWPYKQSHCSHFYVMRVNDGQMKGKMSLRVLSGPQHLTVTCHLGENKWVVLSSFRNITDKKKGKNTSFFIIHWVIIKTISQTKTCRYKQSTLFKLVFLSSFQRTYRFLCSTVSRMKTTQLQVFISMDRSAQHYVKCGSIAIYVVLGKWVIEKEKSLYRIYMLLQLLHVNV